MVVYFSRSAQMLLPYGRVVVTRRDDSINFIIDERHEPT